MGNRTIRRATRALAIAGVASAALMADAQAQQAGPTEEIVVTGSRLRRTGASAPTPLTVASAESLRATGGINVYDMLGQLPQVGVGTSQQNTTNSVRNAGLNILNLRSLGNARTLTLVNGRRQVGGGQGTVSVDTNTIPVALIDRVEVVTGGATAVYGADAVAGVVNFIMKKNYEGAEVEAQYGMSTHGDAQTYDLSATMGGNFGGGRGNITINATYNREEGLFGPDRDYAVSELRSVVAGGINGRPLTPVRGDGIPDRIPFSGTRLNQFTQTGAPLIATAIGTRAAFTQAISPNGQLISFDRFGQADLGGNVSLGGDGLSTGKTATLRVPTQRGLFHFSGNYELLEDGGSLIKTANLFAEFKYARNKAKTTASGTFESAGVMNLQRDNAFLPAALVSQLTAANLTQFTFSRSDDDFGLRTFESLFQTYRGVIGVNGKLGNDWNYETFWNYGTTRSQFTNFDRIQSKFADSVDAVRLPDGSIGCRSAAARANGCLPLNLIGFGIADPRAIAYSYTSTVEHDRLTQNQFVFNTDGDLFKFATPFSGKVDSVKLAMGIEYRREESNANPAAEVQQGLVFGNRLAFTEGHYDTKEAYVETGIPVLRDLPFAKAVDVEGSWRFQDYSTTSTDQSWALRGGWAIDDNIKLRVSRSRAVRAPNIGELFAPGSDNFQGVNDPCDSTRINAGSFPQNRAANCRALGIPANFTQSTVTKSVIARGNPNLAAEKAKTWTAGVVLTPTFVPGLTITADWWNVKIRDAIATLAFQNIVNNCVDAQSLSNPFCSSVIRGPDLNIQNVLVQQLNIARYQARGLDMQITYSTPLSRFGAPSAWGNFTFDFLGSYLSKKTFEPSPSDQSLTNRDAGELPDPKLKFRIQGIYEVGQWQFTWTTNYLGHMELNNEAFIEDAFPHTVPDYWLHSIRGQYDFGKYQVFGGVNNLANKEPPYIPATYLGTGATTGSIYDNRGRFFFMGARAQF
ncbi:TonB-dependent receptor domain-containing protein [Roseiterribacter gracilis]|uniref:TonB-dependent receptor n=1 Tax=Roseiterribacter gracilis TaxID=2812848 RepID=A0A8S8XFR4_9PROT|nr:TonB-dependent receptor [Rhodospirillales bacterium TMPK1]